MAWAALVSGNKVIDVALLEDDPPFGWIVSAEKIGIGWGYTEAGGFTPPPVTAQAPTGEEVVQMITDSIMDGSDRDVAIVLLIADVAAKAFGLSTVEARQLARRRVLAHLRERKGLEADGAG